MISVCMATYNGALFLHQQIESILSQLHINDELIISDDGSTDGSIDIITRFCDDRIKLLYHNYVNKSEKKNINLKRKRCISNFENALKSAKGDIIILSDQDDIWYNNKVEVVVNTLRTKDLMVSDCSIIDEENNVIIESRFAERNPQIGLFKALYRNPYLGCCMAFRSEILKKALPFPSYIPMHDIWLGMIAQLYYKPILLPEILTGYRRHSNNINNCKSNYETSRKQKHDLYPFRKKMLFRWNLLRGLIKVFFK